MAPNKVRMEQVTGAVIFENVLNLNFSSLSCHSCTALCCCTLWERGGSWANQKNYLTKCSWETDLLSSGKKWLNTYFLVKASMTSSETFRKTFNNKLDHQKFLSVLCDIILYIEYFFFHFSNVSLGLEKTVMHIFHISYTKQSIINNHQE